MPNLKPENLQEIQRRLMVSLGPAQEIQTLQREVRAWQERFPKFFFNRLDDLIERNPDSDHGDHADRP